MIQFSRQFFNDPCKTSKYSLHEYCTAPICKRKSYNFHYRGKHPSKIPFLKKQPKGIVSFAAILKHITSIVSLSVPSLFFHSIILQGKMVSSSSTAMPVFGVFFICCLLVLSDGFHQICSLGKTYTDKAYASPSPHTCLVHLPVKMMSCSAQTWIFFPSDPQKPWEEHSQALRALHSSLQPQHLTQSSWAPSGWHCIDIIGYSIQGCVCALVFTGLAHLPFLLCHPAIRKTPPFHSLPTIHFLPFLTGKVPRTPGLFRMTFHLVEHFPDLV